MKPLPTIKEIWWHLKRVNVGKELAGLAANRPLDACSSVFVRPVSQNSTRP